MMISLSALQRDRLRYQPLLPPILEDLLSLVPWAEGGGVSRELDPAIEELFPRTAHQPVLSFRRGPSVSEMAKPLKVGAVFSGGQAPGGHNVISGILDALKKWNPDAQLIGFLEGPSGIIKDQWRALTEEVVAPYRNQGGFDLLGSGRTKIETKEQLEATEQTLRRHELDGLVIIGGDDSNTNAAILAEFCQQRGVSTRIIGVPKTIDGDLQNAFIEISFGFDTACKIYSEIIGNLLKDAISAKKYYFFVKLMGRSASHVTLECALQTQVNLALIGEEVADRKQTLSVLVHQVADLICERAEQGKSYGVILIPEGLLEFIPECQRLIGELNHLLAEGLGGDSFEQEATVEGRQKRLRLLLSQESADCFFSLPEEIQKQLLLDRDPYGNVQVSKIETERLFISLVERELAYRKQQGRYRGKFSAQPIFCGYEGRSGLPSNFDCEYCYVLGHVAALLVRHGVTGYMACVRHLAEPVKNWDILGVPLMDMLHFEMRKGKRQVAIQKALVDLKGVVFRRFKERRDSWRLEDAYCCPGPIQFEGSYELVDRPPLSLGS